MTPELSIVPGEQKDRLELHNKNWDSSSANTPDSSEGDFQTEVWRLAYALSLYHNTQANVEMQMHNEKVDSWKTKHGNTMVFFFLCKDLSRCAPRNCLRLERTDAGKGGGAELF